MNIDISTVVFTIINVLILYLYLRKKFFNRVNDFIENRSEKIEGEIEDAKNNLDESSRIKADWEKKLSDAKNEGRKIVDDYKEKAGTLSDEILTKAREEAGLILERAKTDSEREKEKAREEIREQIVSLSLLAATKAIREELDEKKHHEIIKEFIEEVGI